MQTIVAPSLLSANFGNLDADIEMINRSAADWIHVDVMDGIFVPNLSFGFPIIKAVKAKAEKPLDIHLMLVKPEDYIKKFFDAGASILTIHYEAVHHLHSAIDSIKSLGMKAGVSLNPHTPVHLLEEILPYLDMVLIMSVNPGFGGQTFIKKSLDKIKKLKKLINDTNSPALIEVDGGVDMSNASQLVEAGVDILVAGNTIFNSPDPEATICELKRCSR